MAKEEPKGASQKGGPSPKTHAPRPESESGQTPEMPFVGNIVRDDEDYEARFMKDAMQRAHDAELEALANLALLRSSSGDRNSLMMTIERDQFINPKEVNRRLQQVFEAADKLGERKP